MRRQLCCALADLGGGDGGCCEAWVLVPHLILLTKESDVCLNFLELSVSSTIARMQGRDCDVLRDAASTCRDEGYLSLASEQHGTGGEVSSIGIMP